MAKRYLKEGSGLTPVVVREAAAILNETERTLRKQIAAGRYPLLAGPQSRERVLLRTELVEDHKRRQNGGSSVVDPPATTPPLVRYAMTPEAVARLLDGALRRYVESAAKASRELREHYELRLAAQERTIAAQAQTIAILEEQIQQTEARADEGTERYRMLQDRLVALIEVHASRSLVNQMTRLLGAGHE